jgi:hypothetical protein
MRVSSGKHFALAEEWYGFATKFPAIRAVRSWVIRVAYKPRNGPEFQET